jgi:hypothetical protein
MFNKPFYTVPHPTRGSRMVDLLNDLMLEERIISQCVDSTIVDEYIDFERVNQLLIVKRRKSIDFIKKALKRKT